VAFGLCHACLDKSAQNVGHLLHVAQERDFAQNIECSTQAGVLSTLRLTVQRHLLALQRLIEFGTARLL